MLTNDTLLELNRMMLGLGAPVERDDQGYNQADYNSMFFYRAHTSLTPVQAYKMASTLYRYKNTQLTGYADELDATLKALDKAVKSVNIKAFTATLVNLSWGFNQNVSDWLKSWDRTNYRWTKPNGEWVLAIKWVLVDPLLDKLDCNGYDTAPVRELKAKIEAGEQPTGIQEDTPSKADTAKTFKVHIIRPKDTIDTLDLKVDYDKAIVAALGAVQGSWYSGKVWHFYISDSAKIYNNLKGCGSNIDLTELEPWKRLVDSWAVDYPMKPIPVDNLPFTPYPFQIEDIQTMLKLKKVINGNEMGCGKTFEDIMVGYSIPLPKLVICPATLRLNWVNEIRMVDPNADITVLYDNSKYTTSEWTIIGYPSVHKHLKNLEQSQFQVILADEAHYIQALNNSGNPDSLRAKAVLRLAATAGWVIPTTGTPKTNRNKNLYNILRSITHPLTHSKWAWMNYGKQYCDGQKGAWGWDFEGNSNDSELHEAIKPYMVRHLKRDVLPNLKKVRRVIPVKVDLREYDVTIAEYLANRKNKDAEQLARLMRARKILATQKVGETIDFAKEFVDAGEKIVLVTCFTEVVKILENAFAGNCVKIVGGMNDTQKEAAKQEFQHGKPQVIILNIIAGGVGLTLTAAHNLIINDYDFVPGNVVQVEDRICRGGQTEVSNIYYITAQGADVEEDFVNLLTYKSESINAAVDGGTGETVDFRSLVEKAHGITRSDRVHTIIKADDLPTVPAPKAKKASTKAPKAANTSTVNWKQYTTEQLQDKVTELGLTYTSSDNPNINRMRIIMALKKAM